MLFWTLKMKIGYIFNQIRTWGVRGLFEAACRWPHEHLVAAFLKKSMRDNADTIPQKGITIVAPISGRYSLSKTMRDFIIRLKAVGIPCQVFDTFKSSGRVPDSVYKPLLTPTESFNILKYEYVIEMLNSPIPAGLKVKRCRIAFWESESGILDVFPYLKDSDIVIAMSDFNAAYFSKVLPSDVIVRKIVYPLMPLPSNIPSRAETRQKYGVREEDFLVFFNFDLKAIWRKNPDGLIRAFAKAFHRNDDARLILKTNNANSCADKLYVLRSLAESLGVGSQVIFVNDYLSSSEIYALTGACDVYASLHRGEGFGLGIAEAMQMGKAVVVTAYSAPLEFCGQYNAILVPYKLIKTNNDPLSAKFGYCADADIDFAASALRKLYCNKELATKLGRNAKQFVETHFSDKEFKTSVLKLIEE